MSSETLWYKDPNALLDELRRSRQAGGRAPSIPGYSELRALGRGGQGVVYQAIQQSTGQRVAIKVLSEGAFTSLTGRRRFEREIEVVAALRHPNIVRVYDSGTAPDGRLYSVMEYIEGRRLDEWMTDDGRPSADSDRPAAVPPPTGKAKPGIRQQLILFAKICDAVHYAHQHGIVHRDLKPGNIRIDASGEPHVLDFGLAKDTAGGAESLAVTASGLFMGSLPWASPEQANGFPDGIDVRTDVYSLGVILYQLLTGRLPYEVIGPLREVLNRILVAAPSRPRTINRSVDDELETIILTALAKEPDRRYQSAGELSADIRHYLAGEPIEAKRDSATYVLRKNLRRYRWPLAMVGAFVLLLAASSVVAWTLYVEAKTQGAEAEKQRASAVEASAKLARDNYVNQIALAFAAYRENNMGEMRDHVDRCPPDLRDWEWHYLDRLANLSDCVCRGSQAAVNCVAFSPDGKRVVSTGDDNKLRLWDADSGQELPPFPDLHSVTQSVTFSPDGSRLYSGSNDGILRAWNSETRETIRPDIDTGRGAVTSLALSPQGNLIACGHGSAITLWNATSGEEIRPLRTAEQGPTTSLQFSSDCHRLVAGSAEAVRVWDLDSNDLILEIPSPGLTSSDRIVHQQAGLCGGDKQVFLIGPGFVIDIWDIAAREKARTFRGHTNTVRSVRCSPDGRWLVSAGQDMTVHIWDLEQADGQRPWILRGHDNVVNSIAISPDGRRIASGGADRTVRIWHHPLAEGGRDEFGGPVFASRGCEVSPRSGTTFCPDGRLLVTGVGLTSIWDCRAGEIEVTAFVPHAVAFAVSPNDRLIACGRGWLDNNDAGTKGQVKVLRRGQPPDDQLVWASDIIPDVVHTVAFSPDGHLLAAGSSEKTPDGTVHYGVDLFEADTGRLLNPLRGHTKEVRCLAFDERGTRIASGGADGMIHVWNVGDGKEVGAWQADEQAVYCVRFSVDGSCIASAGGSGRCGLWDVASRTQVKKFSGHRGQALSVAFHPGGRRLVSAGEDDKAKIWDLETGRELLSLQGDAGARWAAFSPDGESLATAGDGSDALQVWETTKPSAELIAERYPLGEAYRIVDALYTQLVPPDQAIALLSDATAGLEMAPEVRDIAIRLAQLRGRDVATLANRSWMIAQYPPRTDLATETERHRQDAEYEYAWRLSEYVCRELAPDAVEHVEYRHTLGVAQYRVGRYEDTVRTLTKTTQQRGWPQDLAFLAMALYRLDHIDEANARLAEAREKVKQPGLNRSEYHRFIEEADALFAAPPLRMESR